jgi:hypothetical protein
MSQVSKYSLIIKNYKNRRKKWYRRNILIRYISVKQELAAGALTRLESR